MIFDCTRSNSSICVHLRASPLDAVSARWIAVSTFEPSDAPSLAQACCRSETRQPAQGGSALAPSGSCVNTCVGGGRVRAVDPRFRSRSGVWERINRPSAARPQAIRAVDPLSEATRAVGRADQPLYIAFGDADGAVEPRLRSSSGVLGRLIRSRPRGELRFRAVDPLSRALDPLVERINRSEVRVASSGQAARCTSSHHLRDR
jgi:hypothetical protein